MLDSAVAQLELPPLRAALLQPVDRNETYSAAKRYADALATEIVPALPASDSRVGMGASLGALSMLHAHRLHPELFAGLFLQSGSFFRRELDGYERGFPRFERIARFVGGVRRARSWDASRARDDDVRPGRGEPRQQSSDERACWRPRAIRSSSSSTATPTTGSRGATSSTRISPSSWSASGYELPARGPSSRAAT